MAAQPDELMRYAKNANASYPLFDADLRSKQNRPEFTAEELVRENRADQVRLDNIDRILSGEEEILPSSGFVDSVMEAVRREAATPPPIPFPWKRALPGLVVAGLTIVIALVACLIPIIREVKPLPLAPSSVSEFALAFEAAKGAGAHWVFLALLLTLASVKFSMRLAGARN